MGRLTMVVVGVATLCGMTAFGQPTATPPTGGPATTPPTTALAPGSPAESEQHILRAHREFLIIHRALIEGVHDPQTLQLVSQALTDWTTLLQAELNEVSQIQALVTAIQGGNPTAIQEARKAVRTATETVVADAKTFSEDCRQIAERLRSLPHPGRHQPAATGGAPAATSH